MAELVDSTEGRGAAGSASVVSCGGGSASGERERESMNELINDLGGKLVSMFVPPDSWALTVMAWMKKSSTIQKVIGVEIPVQEPGLYYSSPPRPPQTMLGMYMY